jgi:thiol-disulfide isomerase/thioredoxin
MGVTACNDLEGSGDKGYVSRDGTVATIAVDDREAAISYDGEDLDGDVLSMKDFRGGPVVVVAWGSWCTDCRVEAPMVASATKQLEGTARFVGINVRDGSTAQALAYVRDQGIDYPSFYSPDGDAILAFRGTLTLQAIPAFVVLDAEGRVAASIIGRLPSTRTLVDLTEDVAKETTRG